MDGDVLTDGEYTPTLITREPDGLIWEHSSVLELDLCWHRGELRLWDPETGEFLPTPEESCGQGEMLQKDERTRPKRG